MNEWEQRFVIKFLWLQEQGSRAIHAHLRGTLEDLAVSFPTVKRWLRRFREGDTSCKDRNRVGRPLAIFRDVLLRFASKCPFAMAKNIANQFNIAVSTVKVLIARELGLRKFTWRRAPHSLSEHQKNESGTQSRLLLDLLQRHQTADFNAICNRRRVVVPMPVSSSHHVCQIP
jgi:transposase